MKRSCVCDYIDTSAADSRRSGGFLSHSFYHEPISLGAYQRLWVHQPIFQTLGPRGAGAGLDPVYTLYHMAIGSNQAFSLDHAFFIEGDN